MYQGFLRGAEYSNLLYISLNESLSSKKPTLPVGRSAYNLIDFVSAAGTVRVQQDFRSGLMFNRIDFWG